MQATWMGEKVLLDLGLFKKIKAKKAADAQAVANEKQ
jgi:hypothetical protein